MDNQFYPPNGGYPQGQQPMQPGVQPQPMGAASNPYLQYMQQGQAQPMAENQPDAYQQQGFNPYEAQQNGYAQQTGYQQDMRTQPMQPQDPNNPYLYYGGNQQPYAEAGYQYHFDHTQSVMQEQPMGFPMQELNPQKPKVRLTVFHVAVILAALGFLAWYLVATFVPEAAKYGTIGSGSLSANHAGDCLIVRNEVPYDAEGVTTVVYDAEEGSSIIRGDKICKVYSSGYSTREMNTLQNYRRDIRDYQKKLIESDNSYDAKMNQVTSKVLTYAKSVRDLIGGARGSLENQEEELAKAVAERQKYMKQKYASDQRFSRLFDDETSQTQRIDSWTKQYTATSSSVVSFYSDGYEYGLTGNNWTTYEPRQVRNMIGGAAPEKSTAQKGKTTIYRMVEDGEWYVLFLSDDTDWNPVKGQVYQLQLERFENTAVYAEVVNFTRSGGELLVRLKVNSSVKPVLYMRTCGAVLGESMSTLRVPERAIYVQDGMTGVVVVDGNTESFIPVEVIHYDNGNAYFKAIQQGLLFEGMTVMLF